MYVNKCTKCGAEFETKNPKRVICPNCLYPDKKNDSDMNQDSSDTHNHQESTQQDFNDRQGSYSAGGYSADARPRRDDRPYQQDRPRYDSQRNYNQGGYNRPQQGGYNRPQGGYNNRPQQGGYNRPQGGYNNRPQQGGYNRPQGGFNRNARPQRPAKQLLINKEQLFQIEELYKKMLPLPNPDAHEVIGEQIGLEARKVFFGINLVRQKMMLPKLNFPKRKLAVSPDQLTAIKMLYEPLLPLPPIGCHKIISAQLKIDEWRVHVGIGLIRKQLGLDRWNPERADAPEEFKQQAKVVAEEVKAPEKETATVVEPVEEEKPKKRGRKKVVKEPEEAPKEDE